MVESLGKLAVEGSTAVIQFVKGRLLALCKQARLNGTAWG